MLRRPLIILSVAAAVLVAIAVVLILPNLLQEPPAKPQPVVVAEFDDGEKLEITGVSVGERITEDRPASKFLPRLFVRMSGTSGRSIGDLSVKSRSENGRVVHSSASLSSTKAAMLIELRLITRYGKAKQLPGYLNRNWVSQESRLGGTSGPGKDLKLDSSNPEDWATAMTSAGMQLLIQHRDSMGNWINLPGPFMFHETRPDRYLVALPVWQRDLPALDFRAIREDGAMKEFSLPNPDLQKAAAAPTFTPFPIVHRGRDFSVTLSGVERFHTKGDHPVSTPEIVLEHGGKPIEGKFGDALRFGSATVEDEWGNQAPLTVYSFRRKRELRAFLPAASRRMTIHLTVVRTADYPQRDSTGFTVLEGIVSADGQSVDFSNGPDVALFGLNLPTATIKPVSNRWSYEAPKDWKQLEFEISGNVNLKSLATIQKRIGDVQKWQFLVFPGGSHESGGLVPAGGSSSGGSIKSLHFSRDMTWIAPPEMLRPGAQLKIGVHSPLPSDGVKFDLELPATIQTR